MTSLPVPLNLQTGNNISVGRRLILGKRLLQFLTCLSFLFVCISITLFITATVNTFADKHIANILAFSGLGSLAIACTLLIIIECLRGKRRQVPHRQMRGFYQLPSQI